MATEAYAEYLRGRSEWARFTADASHRAIGHFERSTDMDPDFARHIAHAAECHAPARWMHMPSAAGHDPMVIAHHLPCAMLFIPSINGISHDFAEDSKREDIALGCQVLAQATEDLLLQALAS